MADKKTHDPQELVVITLPWEDWQTVLHWLTYGADYHHAKMQEWMASCVDKRMAATKAAEHEVEAIKAESLAKIIEAALYPAPPKETE